MGILLLMCMICSVLLIEVGQWLLELIVLCFQEIEVELELLCVMMDQLVGNVWIIVIDYVVNEYVWLWL